MVGTLEVKLVGGSKSSARRYTENVEAYKYYLRGRYYWHKRTPEAIRKARKTWNSRWPKTLTTLRPIPVWPIALLHWC